MKTRLTPHLIQLTSEAALRSFWRKRSLYLFLTRSGVQNLPAWPEDETKRDYLARVFDSLQVSDEGQGKILQLAHFLADQSSFPDLDGWEDSANMMASAERSVAALKEYLSQQDAQLTAEQQRYEARQRYERSQARMRASYNTLSALEDRLNNLAMELGTSSAGTEFENWFYDLMAYSEITSRRPYKIGGREIDGSITIGDTTYLVECKFTTSKTGAPDIDIFRSKVESKADNTMGIFISMSGYSSVAISGASGRKTPLLLIEHGHLYRVLRGISSFREVVERLRRHASQTGEAYMSVDAF